jgi:VanZ family protein
LSSAPSTRSSEAGAHAAPARPNTLARWLPVVVWAGFISWFSTDAFSARSTNNYIDPVIRFLFGDLSPEGFRVAHAVVRKSAHFIEYAVLAVLVGRALTPPPLRLPRGALARTIVCCALYASLDELHQLFVPSRGASPWDVGLDTLGATIGALLLVWRRAVSGPP